MAVLMPALQKVKRQARTTACQVNLKQWSIIWSVYCDDNNGFFLSSTGAGSGRWWIEPMTELYEYEADMRVCPQAKKPWGSDYSSGIGYWSFHAWQSGDYIGSYGPNGWMCSPRSGATAVWGRGPVADHWRTPRQKGADKIPFFNGSWWV